MEIAIAQREVRYVFRGGIGQLVSGAIWIASAAAAQLGTHRAAILILLVGGFFIFPLTTLLLKLLGGPTSLSRGNPLNALGMQAAFVLPLTLPLVGAAAIHRIEWFYPAVMIAVGAHYLPFITLYGMRMFAPLCGILVSLGFAFARLMPDAPFAAPAWVGGLVLLAFGALGPWLVARERRSTAA